MPQLPQWLASVDVFTQPEPQHVVAPAHARPLPMAPEVLPHVQRPEPEHASPGPHDTPHAPQLDSDTRATSQPLPSMPSQSARPALQAWIRQLPVEQVAVAAVRAHVTPHEPQLVRVVRLVSQPSAATELQSLKPGLHDAIMHAPPEHTPVERGGAQILPQPPQLVVDV